MRFSNKVENLLEHEEAAAIALQGNIAIVYRS
jgi:hypothetical protein